MTTNDLINLDEVTKTLRFELKPSQNTFKKIFKKVEKNDFYDLSVDKIAEKIKIFVSSHTNELKKINSIWDKLLNEDKTKIFISSQFLEKLYKYSFLKKGVKEPKRLPKKNSEINH